MVSEFPDYLLDYRKLAVDILKETGYTSSEIHQDYDVELKENGRIKYTVDVAGISDKRKTAIECKYVTAPKIINLRRMFDDVIVMSTTMVLNMYDALKRRCYIDLNERDETIKRLTNQMQLMCDDANKRVDSYSLENRGLREENQKLKSELTQIRNVIAKACQN